MIGAVEKRGRWIYGNYIKFMESWQARSRKGLQDGGGYFEMEKTMKASDLYVQTPDKQNSPHPGCAVGPWMPGKVSLMEQLLGTPSC